MDTITAIFSSCVSSCAEILSLVLDFFSLLVGIAVAGAAWMGLSTWKEQLKGKNEYNLARRLLKSIYQYRDIIAYFRINRIIYRPVPEENALGKSEEQRKFMAIKADYDERTNRVNGVRGDIYPDAIEAQILWGDEIKSILDNMAELERQLSLTAHFYLTKNNPETSEGEIGIAQWWLENNEGVLFSRNDKKDDPFAQKFDDLVEKAKKILEEKMKQ